MKRKAVAASFIMVLLFSATGLALADLATANPMWYLPTIVIDSDGSVEPQTEYIKRDGNVYTLTADLPQKYAIKIQCSNIVFDGAVTIYYGPANNGLSLESVTNVTVKDIVVSDFLWDVSIENSRECVLIRVKAIDLQLQNSDFNRIVESTIDYDLRIQSSNNNTFTKNNIISWVNLDGYANTFYENNFGRLSDFPVDKTNFWDNGSVGNYWSGYEGVDENGDGIGDTPYVINAEAQDRFPLMNPWDPEIPYDTVPPRITILSPENKVYDNSSVSLVFSVCESASSMSYSLDGQDNVTVTGNTTLSELPNGSHNLTVYVTDRSGNTGASETISFSVEVPEAFPAVPVAVASVATVAVVGVGLLVYFRRRNHRAEPRFVKKP